MKTLKNIGIKSIGFISSKPWLALFLIPVFYGALRTPQHSWLLHSVNGLLPSGVQAEVRKSEPVMSKLAHSVVFSAMLGLTFYAVGQSRVSSLEE